ncbi:type II pantothenate kinase [Paenibacillus senegalensis]|uniref:type II pantothenate kinase n=1 Tax=Paenibacillus senegalensis TaxID=1465766 RepID=UPI0002899D3C|nr:type II pantothenate kinase [Paenibacillus senegalensis]
MNINEAEIVGIDAGGTLIKVVSREKGDGGALAYRKFHSSDLPGAAAWIRSRYSQAKLCITGGKAALMEALLNGCSGYSVSTIVEFEATYRGVRYILNEGGQPLDNFVLTNVGTGTSIHHVQESGQVRIGGTGVGGGTMLGLAALLTGVTDYEQMVRLAEEGQRDHVDLKVKHIYEGAEPPIPGNLTASNFGHVRGRGASFFEKADLLASAIGLVGETVATTSVLAAGQCGVANVVYIGSSFVDNEPLRKAVEGYTILRGASPVFLSNGEFSGAIGALLDIMPEVKR